MKKLFLFLMLGLAAFAQPTPVQVVEASAAQVAAGVVGAPYYVSPRRLATGGGPGVFSSVTDTGLTSGRLVYASTGGLLADSAQLTFTPSTGVALGSSLTTGLQLYNTADQTTNYERLEALFSSNIGIIRTTAAGSGTFRNLRLAQGTDTTFTLSTFANNAFAFAMTGTQSSTSGNLLTASVTRSNTSGTTSVVSITPTYNQASGTAANTDLLVNRTETAIGSGAQFLIDAQVASASKFSVSNAGLITGSGLNSQSTNTELSIMAYNVTAAAGGNRSVRMAEGTFSNSSGTTTAVRIIPTYNQSSTAAATDLLINRTQTAVGSGAQLLIDAQVGGSSQFSVTNGGIVRATTAYSFGAVPAAAGAFRISNNNGFAWRNAGNTSDLSFYLDGSNVFQLQGPLSVTGNLTASGALITTPQALSGAGAINVTTSATEYTSTGVAQALTLANGTVGQIKTVVHTVDGGNGILTPTTKIGYTTITFTNVGDSVTLQYTTTGWAIIGIFGAVAA